ncbi:MAG: purine-nucleoside phosphorylase [bacterium]
MTIPTPHINAKNKSDFAKTVLMPGDPLRAKFIADTFLENVVEVNSVRNMLGYTGTYKGKKISVMGSGMGMPSIGIYSYELFAFYGVENIIRIGSAGSYSEDLDVYDVVLASAAYSESSYASVQAGIEDNTLAANKELNDELIAAAKKLNIPMKEAVIHSSDVFYRQTPEQWKQINKDFDCKCVEMESFALFANAQVLGKKAACLVTISDSFTNHKVTTSEERQNSFTKMMEVALELAND